MSTDSGYVSGFLTRRWRYYEPSERRWPYTTRLGMAENVDFR